MLDLCDKRSWRIYCLSSEYEVNTTEYAMPTHYTMLPLSPNVTLEPYTWTEDDNPPSLRTSPRKRKEKEIYESEPFQKSLQSKRKKGKEKEHTPSISDDNDLSLANDLEGMESYQARQSHISKKRRPGRQPDQHPVVGKRLTEDDDVKERGNGEGFALLLGYMVRR